MDAPDGFEGKKPKNYVKEYSRVSKDDLYMMIALLMENYVDAEAPENYKKVGAVLVLPNDIVQAADCSRDDVNAVVRLLMKHHDKTEGCKMFISRKPCPMCAKRLVQSKVNRIFFPPFEPEYYPSPKKDSMMSEVENLFTASSIAVTRFILHVDAQVIEDCWEKHEGKAGKNAEEKSGGKAEENAGEKAGEIAEEKAEKKAEEKAEEKAKKKAGEIAEGEAKEKVGGKSSKIITQDMFNKIKKERDDIKKKYVLQIYTEWKKVIKEKLPWPAFDKEMEAMFETYFTNAMELIGSAKVLRGSGLDYTLEKAKSKEYTANDEIEFEKVSLDDDDDFLKKVRHFVTIARLLAERTDDPRTGVGAVIVSKDMQEIISFGWNGFPMKALYGEFPRASRKDIPPAKKDSYVIHAEQNAILFRNQKDIKGSIMFVTRNPCDECAPLIAMHGVETVVVDPDDGKDVNSRGKEKGYKKFPRLVKEGKFVCYQTKKEEEEK